jgi:hypothetical protein
MQMLKKTLMIMLLFPFLGWETSKAQEISADDLKFLKAEEKELVVLADSMFHAFMPEIRSDYNIKFVKRLRTALQTPNSYYYTFPTLSNYVNFLSPEAGGFRIINWNVPVTDNTLRYYGAIQLEQAALKLFPLVDYSTEIKEKDYDSVYSNTKWFGCLYYKIITQEVQGQRVYTLFGLNAEAMVSNKKLLDVLVMTDKGPVFGYPLFSMNSLGGSDFYRKRFVMEYKKDVQASLNYDKEMKMIYFDKLVSQVNDPNRKYTYVPSGQYDGFRWEEDHWQYVSDFMPALNLKDGEAPTK